MAIVELENVEVHYGELKALDGVSCSIEGGAVGLLGPNGAGKSTLLKTLLGFNRASHGHVTMFGKDMPRHAKEVRHLLGYMPEREAVSPRVTGVSFLTYCGELQGMSGVDAMKRTHEVMNYVGLGESRYRKMETYSTGMLQRLKFAQSLIHAPKLLLLDEPTNGLDPKSRLEMLELIREVSGRGITTILSSHLLPDVQHVCDHIIILNKGKVVRQATIEEMTAPRKQRYEVRVHGQLDAFVTAVRAAGFVCEDPMDGELFISTTNGQDSRSLYGIALDCGTQVRHLQPVRQSLAEAFMDALGASSASSSQMEKN